MPSSQPTVSVLLPVRDAEPYLETCLRSLERQTFTDFELVAIDDGSTDGSAERLATWCSKHPRWRLVKRPHRGLIVTLNEGLELCRGNLIARLDADDAMASRRFEHQVRALQERPDVDVVSCLVSHFPRRELGQGLRLYERWLNRLVAHEDILRERFVESPLPHPSVMMRRQALVDAGGYRDRDWPEDYDLWLRLASCGCRFHKVPQRLYFWRDHPGRETRINRRYATNRFLACKAHHLMHGPLRENRPLIVWGAGQTGRRLSKHLLAEGAQIEAFIDIDPKKIGGTLRGISVHGPDVLIDLKQRYSEPLILAAVSARGARNLIRRQLDGNGWQEGWDYWCVA